MTTTIRTYSKKAPRAVAPVVAPPAGAVLDGWDELDAIMSEDSVRKVGKRKEGGYAEGKENYVNQCDDARHKKKAATPSKSTPTKRTTPLTQLKSPTTPPKEPLASQTTPTKSQTQKTPTKTPTRIPTKSPKSPKTPTKSPKTSTKSPTPTKSPKTPTRDQKTPTKTPTKSPKSPISPAICRRNSDTRALKDELDYLLDGLDSSSRDIRRESMYKLGVEFRKGINNAPVGQLLRDSAVGEAIIQRLVDVLLLRWDDSFCKDKASFLCAAVILHALARDPANIPHLSRCQPLLRDIVFSTEPKGRGDDIEKQAVAFVADCGAFVAQDDYTSIGNANSNNNNNNTSNTFQLASSMAVRTLAALSFTRSISDDLRQEGIVSAVEVLVFQWISRLPSPPPPTSPFAQESIKPNLGDSPFVDVYALLDIKYSLIILENATFVNPENQKEILRNDCRIIHAIIKLILIARNIVMLPKSEDKPMSCVTLIDAATDCIIGCLKLLLNLTYNRHDACDSVRLACAASNTNSASAKGKRKAGGKDSTTKESPSLGGLAVLLSLLTIQFDEDMFDIHQHVIGLLINLVEENPLNRQQIGEIDGAISAIVALYLKQKTAEEQKKQNQSNVGIVGAAYCAMLLGWLANESPANTTLIQAALPAECPLSSLALLLKYFMSFQLQAGILPDDVHKSLVTVMQVLENTK